MSMKYGLISDLQLARLRHERALATGEQGRIAAYEEQIVRLERELSAVRREERLEQLRQEDES
jgi:hypothetical protein